MIAPTILRIAVAAPLPGLFDYLPPAGVEPTRLLRGIRLRIPFGRSGRIGFLWELAPTSELPLKALKPALELLDEEPLMPEDDLDFLNWAAEYYQHPLGEVLLGALPVKLRKTEAIRSAAPTAWRLTAEGWKIDPVQLTGAPRQAAALGLLRHRPEGAIRETLYAECGPCPDVLRRLQDKGWIETCPAPAVKLSEALEPGPTLNAGQSNAVTAVSEALGEFRAFLLDGVTGSGKTEVYLCLIEQALKQGGQILVLVPEIGLTPQLQRHLARRIRTPIALLHSALPEGERVKGWWAARDGSAGVVLGTRSAVFAPMPRLSLILVDEEHDLSFKQQDGFRYSARDLAVRRAQQRRCPVLLGSATPSLESLRNASSERYTWLHLPARAGKAKPPRLDLIDIRSVRLDNGLSPAMIRLLRENLDAGHQSLVFLNRRGFAPVMTCHNCGWVAGCPHCDARLTMHLGSDLLWCHHCGYQHRIMDNCPSCGGADLKPLGQGTERLESTLRQLFDSVPTARIDRDSTRRRGALEKLLEEARSGRYPLLIGTQMLAKGHHFPEVTLVGILDVDQGLYGADYRAAERMAQLVVQVAGRAGRAEKPGRVAIQTHHPDHPLLQTLIHRGYGAFAAMALDERDLAKLPPFGYQVLLRAEATDIQAPHEFLSAAVAAAGTRPPDIQLWGPVPAPMERRAGRFRAHLLVQVEERSLIQKFLSTWVPSLYRLKQARQVRWSLDVDPQEML